MCDIDLEPCTAFSERNRKARKAHTCSCCKGIILPGQTYLVHFSIYDGNIASDKMCGLCEVARKEFSDAHYSGLPQPAYFPELLSRCISDGDEESDAKWRPMLDAIEARGKAARALTDKRGAGSDGEGTDGA